MHDEALLDEVGRVDCGVVLWRARTAAVAEWLAACVVYRRTGSPLDALAAAVRP